MHLVFGLVSESTESEVIVFVFVEIEIRHNPLSLLFAFSIDSC